MRLVFIQSHRLGLAITGDKHNQCLREMDVGITLLRSHGESEGIALNLAYIDTDKRYPVEYTVGYIRGTANAEGEQSQDVGYIGVGLRKYWQRVFLGLGVAAVSETSDGLSTAFNYKSQIGYDYKTWVIKVEHLSNAGINGENQGENIVTIGYQKRL